MKLECFPQIQQKKTEPDFFGITTYIDLAAKIFDFTRVTLIRIITGYEIHKK